MGYRARRRRAKLNSVKLQIGPLSALPRHFIQDCPVLDRCRAKFVRVSSRFPSRYLAGAAILSRLKFIILVRIQLIVTLSRHCA